MNKKAVIKANVILGIMLTCGAAVLSPPSRTSEGVTAYIYEID